MEEAPWDPLKLWCGNLRSDVAAGEILAAFEEEGVWGITSVYPFPRGERDACAFLTFENTQQARFAIAQLNGWAIPAVSSGTQGLAIRFTNAPAGKGKGKSKAKNMYSYENMVDHGAHGHMLSEPPVAEVEVASPDQGKPRALMEAELGSKELFDQGLADGDILEIIFKGQKLYQYREFDKPVAEVEVAVPPPPPPPPPVQRAVPEPPWKRARPPAPQPPAAAQPPAHEPPQHLLDAAHEDEVAEEVASDECVAVSPVTDDTEGEA